jgi:hypothetical protein
VNLLAFRVGPAQTPPALCDARSESLVPLVPDEASRGAWLAAIFDAIARLIELELSRPEDSSANDQRLRVIDPDLSATRALRWREKRPTRLPTPGELAEGDLASNRLKRLARMGHQLLQKSVAEAPGSVARRAADPWAALICSYLQGDFAESLARLESLELTTRDIDTRTRLLGLRAQIYLGMGQLDRAGAVLDGLGAIAAARARTVETTAAGQVLLLDDHEQALPWFDALRRHYDERILARVEPEEGEPAFPIWEGIQLEAPLPGLRPEDLAPIQAPAPMPPARRLVPQRPNL